MAMKVFCFNKYSLFSASALVTAPGAGQWRQGCQEWCGAGSGVEGAVWGKPGVCGGLGIVVEIKAAD